MTINGGDLINQFKFELASLLEFRQQEEQNAKQAYAVAQQGVIQSQNMITKLFNEKYELFAYAVNSVELLQAQRRYLVDMDRQISDQQARKVECERNVQIALDGLVEKQQARKVIEKLYEKKLAQYNAKLQQAEQNFLDEVGTQTYMRNQAI